MTKSESYIYIKPLHVQRIRDDQTSSYFPAKLADP